MSHHERTGRRDLLYSGWHRPSRIRRYVDAVTAAKLLAVDIDWCEACVHCSRPLALVETQESRRTPKPATITGRLAVMAGIPAYSVSYTPTDDGGDIAEFRVRQVAPERGDPLVMTPAVYAYWLWGLRRTHDCAREGGA